MSQFNILEVPTRIRALSLLSGGLDSQLAICVLKEQGLDVHAITFDSPFFSSHSARLAAEQLGVPFHVKDFTADIVSLLRDPPHGFGSQMNPCTDCHALMIRRAGEMMEAGNFHFISTGEVLNQRPMSQRFESMNIVAQESGYKGFLVRPLCAGLLPETEPERRGWVDRNKLLSIQGRTREAQLRLAERYGLKDTPSPAGGCRLTDPNFVRRLRELSEHEGLSGARSLVLLRYGRHFRFGDNIKLILGRNEDDNLFLEGVAELYDLVLKPETVHGPTGLLHFTAREEQIALAASVCARYSDSPSGSKTVVRVRSARGVRRIEALPAAESEVERLRI